MTKKVFNFFSLYFPPVLWCFVIFYFSCQPNLKVVSGPWDFLLRKFGHIFEYFLLTILVARATDKSIFKIGKRGLIFGAISSLVFAALDEYHQTFIPGRFGVVSDVGIDSVGIVLAVGILKAFDFLRKK